MYASPAAGFRQCLALLSRANGFAPELLLREVLTNAVVHGCHTDPRKQVCCSLRVKGGRVLIAVEDTGDGFDWRAGGPNREHG